MAAPTPYLGSKICLISKAEIRYEGILYTIDSKESTVALAKVRSFGTEDRKTDTPFPPRDEIFEYIIFKAADIKDLRVCQPPIPTLAQDPAIVSHSIGPPPPPAGGAPSFGDFSGTPYGQQPPMFMPPHQSQSPFGSALGLSPGSLMATPGAPIPSADPNLGGFPPKAAPCAPIVEASRTSTPEAPKHQEHRREGEGEEDHRRPGHSNSNSYRGNAEGYNKHPPREGGQRGENYGRDNYQQRRGGPHGSSQEFGHGGGGGGGGYGQMRGRGGGMGRGRGGMGGLRPRGQLQANKEPLKFDEEFDFEQANLEFQELESKMAKTKISDGAGTCDDESYTWSEEENQEEAKSEGKPAPTDGTEPAEYYNKSKSFFDQISCEALERQNGANTGRVDWRHERSINKETFGVSAPPSWGYRRGGWNGGYNNYRGRGGYGYNRSRGYGGNRNYDNRGHGGGNQGGYGGYGSNRAYDSRNRNNGPPRGGHRGRPAPPQQA
ncbi:protein LSM14 homolog B [Galendromus occidentalis]|uniref:Protein LSM14 homolog B n=1 Tax=Galendromus occidentalis TaxID=34638 RepID=A0AAJ6QMF1_9ACAR|nr:protein LSM14 homolog B [Galendromus occidentalis]